MRPDYLQRFMDMVDELRRNPQIAVSRVHVAPPVSQDVVAKVETTLGFELSDRIVGLYRQANGLALEWVPREHSAYDPGSHDEELGEPFDMVPQDVPGGVINLYPLEALLDDFEDVFWYGWMAGQTTELAGASHDLLEFSKAIRPIDYYSEPMMAALYLGDRVAYPPVLIGEDHGASFTAFPPTDFETYLEGVLALRGSGVGRERFFCRAGSRPRTAEAWRELAQPLDELLRWSVEQEHAVAAGTEADEFSPGDFDEDAVEPGGFDPDLEPGEPDDPA